jgi:hypothetical protein
MLYVHPSLVKRTSDLRRADRERQAEHWRLLREAGLDRRRCLPKAGCRLLRWLGHRLVSAGEWLERQATLKGFPSRTDQAPSRPKSQEVMV